METTKKCIRYALGGFLLFLFVTYAAETFVMQSYQPIKTNIVSSSPEIIIDRARATPMNGYVEGSVKNNTSGYINNTNLKVDFYGKTGTYLGSKYLELGNFKQNETKDFGLTFDQNNVKECKVSLVNKAIDTEEIERILGEDTLRDLGKAVLITVFIYAFFFI